MKPTIFSYASIVLALGACIFSVKSHDIHHRNDVRALAPSTDASKLDDILTISPEENKNWVHAEDGVIIDFLVKNNSDKTLKYYTVNGYPEFNFSVTDEKHKAVPLTRYGNLILNPKVQESGSSGIIISSASGVNLNPGKKYTSKILLSQIYDMSIPGKYFITASRNVIIGRETEPIKSNLLEIEVDPYIFGQLNSNDIEYIAKQREKQVQEQVKKNDDTNTHQ